MEVRPQSKESRETLDAGRGKERDSPQEPLQENGPDNTLIWDVCWISGIQKCNIVTLGCFKPFKKQNKTKLELTLSLRVMN